MAHGMHYTWVAATSKGGRCADLDVYVCFKMISTVQIFSFKIKIIIKERN